MNKEQEFRNIILYKTLFIWIYSSTYVCNVNLDEANICPNTFVYKYDHNIFISFKALNLTIDNCILFI